MKRKLVFLVLSLLCGALLLSSCGNGNECKDKLYVNDKSSILLREDGTFKTIIVQGEITPMEITGKYTIKGEDIEFNSEKMNGEELGSTTNGKLKGDTIIDPGGRSYERDKSYKGEKKEKPSASPNKK